LIGDCSFALIFSVVFHVYWPGPTFYQPPNCTCITFTTDFLYQPTVAAPVQLNITGWRIFGSSVHGADYGLFSLVGQFDATGPFTVGRRVTIPPGIKITGKLNVPAFVCTNSLTYCGIVVVWLVM
jgi:hypothetical protein